MLKNNYATLMGSVDTALDCSREERVGIKRALLFSFRFCWNVIR